MDLAEEIEVQIDENEAFSINSATKSKKDKKNYFTYLRYNKDWEKDPKFKRWIAPVPGDDKFAFCKFCKQTLWPSKKDIIKHSETKKHKKASSSFIPLKTYDANPEFIAGDKLLICDDMDSFIKCETVDTSETDTERITIKFSAPEGEASEFAEPCVITEDLSCTKSPEKLDLTDLLSAPQYKDWLTVEENHLRCLACKCRLKPSRMAIYSHSLGKVHSQKCTKKNMKNTELTVDGDLDKSKLKNTEILIDLRSDSVTLPSERMKDAMYNAKLGDDSLNTDSIVPDLEQKVATILDKEAGLILPSGTMANLVAIFTHCWERDSEVVLGKDSQINKHLRGSLVKYGGIPTYSISNDNDGTFDLKELSSYLYMGSMSSSRSATMLVCVENTHTDKGGKALPFPWIEELEGIVDETILLHMDGTRLLNASVASGRSPSEICRSFHSVALALDKGLGTPIGAVLAGSSQFIQKATRVRNMLGGMLHQAGIFAAAGLHALTYTSSKLYHDHANARKIAYAVREIHSSAITVDVDEVQTNIVHLKTDNIRVTPQSFCDRLKTVSEEETSSTKDMSIKLFMTPLDLNTVQFMTHIDINRVDVDLVIMKLQFVIGEIDSCLQI